jgi:hypothetical protein
VVERERPVGAEKRRERDISSGPKQRSSERERERERSWWTVESHRQRERERESMREMGK